VLDIQEIQRIIPHRYPFLLIDKIIELKEGESAIGIKNVTANEEFFNGHFPDYSVMPGVLIVEALAQVSGIIMLQKEENHEKIGLLTGIENCRFKKQSSSRGSIILRSRNDTRPRSCCKSSWHC